MGIYADASKNIEKNQSITQIALDAKKEALRLRIQQALNVPSIPDPDNVEQEFLQFSLLLGASRSLLSSSSPLYLGHYQLGQYFDAAAQATPLVRDLVEEAILCNFLQDNLDMKPIVAIAPADKKREEKSMQNSMNEEHNESIKARKFLGYQKLQQDAPAIFFEKKKKAFKIRIDNLITSKSDYVVIAPNPLKMKALRTAQLLFAVEMQGEQIVATGWTASNRGLFYADTYEFLNKVRKPSASSSWSHFHIWNTPAQTDNVAASSATSDENPEKYFDLSDNTDKLLKDIITFFDKIDKLMGDDAQFGKYPPIKQSATTTHGHGK